MSVSCTHCNTKFDFLKISEEQGSNVQKWVCPVCGGQWK